MGVTSYWDEEPSPPPRKRRGKRADDTPPPTGEDEWRSIERSAPEPDAEESSKPTIILRAGQIDKLATQAEAAVIAAGLPVFQRGPQLVRPVRQEAPASKGRMTVVAGFRDIGPAAMIDMLAQGADWQKFDGRRKQFTPCDPPRIVADVILSRVGHWTAPIVAGVITTPTLRPDGTLLTEAGYDAATRLYHVPDPSLVLNVKDRPTGEDGTEALTILDSLLDEFPFVSDTDRSVALSALITPVVRGAMPVAPLHAIKASTAGTGKSYLADLASAIATGRPCPVASMAARVEETESRLVGLLLAAFPVISIDNVNGELGGDLLCQAVERPIVRVRRLGGSDIFEIESRATFFATGNGIRVRGDMTRRTLLCNLDAGMERPEERSFSHRPVDQVIADRGKYVAAALTVCRAFLAAGSPEPPRPLISFEEWSGLVRAALVWLGRPDPVDSMEAAREGDPELAELREVLTCWKECFNGSGGMPIRDIVDRVSAEPDWQDFRDALQRVAGIKGTIDKRRLGNWIRGKEGRIVDGLRFRRGIPDAHSKVETWYVG